jgi:D-alanine-D-alanine ligase
MEGAIFFFMKNKRSKKRKPPTTKNGLKLPQKVGIIYSDVKREYFPTEQQYLTEKDAGRDAEIIASYLKNLGVKIFLYAGNALLPEKLKKDKPDMVINLVDSVQGNEYLSSTIPGVLELLEIPYTGAGILGLSLDHNKFLVKKVLQQIGVPVPSYQLFNTPYDPIDPTLRFPIISKLNEIQGAVEITQDSVSENENHLRKRIEYLINTYDQPVLAEEFIVGREFTAMLLEGLNKKVYLAEKVFTKPPEKYVFSTFDDMWTDNNYENFHYQKYEDSLLSEYVKKAFSVIRMADYGKFDVRVDSSGRYFFLDANCNPAFGPKETTCAISVILDLYGVNFYEILKRLLLNTMRDMEGKKRLPLTENETQEATGNGKH